MEGSACGVRTERGQVPEGRVIREVLQEILHGSSKTRGTRTDRVTAGGSDPVSYPRPSLVYGETLLS